jgi:hypothetical protein
VICILGLLLLVWLATLVGFAVPYRYILHFIVGKSTIKLKSMSIKDLFALNGVPSKIGDVQLCAYVKGDGQPCRGYAIKGCSYCRLHVSALSPNMVASIKQGRYLKSIPRGLLDSYVGLLEDPEYLTQRQEMGLLTARVEQLLKSLASNDSATMKLEAEIAEYDAAVADGDENAQLEAAARLRKKLKTTQREWAIWGEIRTLILDKASLAKVDLQRLKLAEQFIEKGQIAALFSALANSVRNKLPSEYARVVHDELRRLTGVEYEPEDIPLALTEQEAWDDGE